MPARNLFSVSLFYYSNIFWSMTDEIAAKNFARKRDLPVCCKAALCALELNLYSNKRKRKGKLIF